MLTATKPGRMVSYLDYFLPIKLLHLFDHMVLQDHMTNQNYYISTTYNEEFPLIKLHDLQSFKYFISPLASDQ